MHRFTCNTTVSDFIQALRNESTQIFLRNFSGKPMQTDGERWYHIHDLPQVRRNGYGGYMIEYRIESYGNDPGTKEFIDAHGQPTSVDPTRRDEPGITFNVQPVGKRARITAECGHEAGRKDFEALLDIVGSLYPESELARRKTAQDAETLPSNPPMPGADGYTWDDVFDWYYNVPKSVCKTLSALAQELGYAYGTVRNKHKEYQAEHPRARR